MRLPAPITTARLALAAFATPALAAAHPAAPAFQTPPPSFTERDSTRTHRHARLLQARFERLRVRTLPRTPDGDSQECDEVVGRLCLWDDDDDDWEPKEEAPEIVAARAELLASLDSLGALLPGDHWIFGQRIQYLVEAGDLGGAEARGRRCMLPESWRCDAYLGYVHHHQMEFGRAEDAFRRAMEAMPEEVRRDWLSPGLVLDRDLRRWLAGQPDSAGALDRLWTLADPLFVAEGNDRWTGHMSRRTYSMSRERARNPHGINWGDDFTEVVVRYGWPAGWERTWPRVGRSNSSVIWQDFRGAFRTFPASKVIHRDPAVGEPVVWSVPERHPRTTYLPPYLDSLGELDGQAGRFWRTGHVVVVAAWRAPDTVEDEDEVKGDADGSEAAGAPGEAVPVPLDTIAATVLSGLFVEQEGEIRGDARADTDPGSPVRLKTRVPWADWGTLSMEAWAPAARQAYRFRAGMGFRRLPPNLFAVSDLMFLEAGTEPGTLDEMVDVLRTTTEVRGGEGLGVAMEVYGLGFRREEMGMRAWVEKRNEGVLVRMGRWLRLTGPREVVSITWREAGPRNPEPLLRAFTIAVPREAGEYDVVVEVSVPGRSPLAVRRGFTVR